MTQKPDRATAMRNIIEQAKITFPLDDPQSSLCSPDGNCRGCPKKLVELVDSELTYWEHFLAQGMTPGFDDIRRFGKLCTNVLRGLTKNAQGPSSL